MSPTEPTPPDALTQRAFAWLLGIVTLALGWILLPFYGTILWGGVIALLFAPLNRLLRTRLRGRRTVAALLTVATVVFIVILPLSLVAAALATEAAQVYQRLQSGEWNPAQIFRSVHAALPGALTELLDRYGLINVDVLQSRVVKALEAGSRLIATQALSLGQDTFEFLARLFITLYLAFFLIRDGEALARRWQQALPMAREHRRALVEKFTTVIRATVKGNLLVALIQGALGGLAFAVLGVNAALLWAVLMACLSLVPAVGAALVWAPVALYFFLTGALWQGLVLTAWGVLVIGLVDNLLRPMLVGKDTRLPDAVVMITTLGGLAVFGLHGFVLGPVIAAMFMAVWHIRLANAPQAPPEDPA